MTPVPLSTQGVQSTSLDGSSLALAVTAATDESGNKDNGENTPRIHRTAADWLLMTGRD